MGNPFSRYFNAEFGTENISNIEMSAFAKDFLVIHLMNSLLNISSETKSNIAGAESVFKQIVAGDMVSELLQGKDMISFRPRSKLFIACNEYMKSRRHDRGLFAPTMLHRISDALHRPSDSQMTGQSKEDWAKSLRNT